jgi:hypothetical protein
MVLGAVQLGFNLALHCPVEPRDRLHVSRLSARQRYPVKRTNKSTAVAVRNRHNIESVHWRGIAHISEITRMARAKCVTRLTPHHQASDANDWLWAAAARRSMIQHDNDWLW